MSGLSVAVLLIGVFLVLVLALRFAARKQRH